MSRDAASEEARVDVREGKGSSYGVGFRLVREVHVPGLDGRQFEYAITDGERDDVIQVIAAETAIAVLGGASPATDEAILAWIADRLYRRVGSFPRSGDRFAALLSNSPIRLSSLDVD